MRLLFDQNVPKPLASELHGHEVTRAAELGWEELVNGQLIAAAEAARFEVLVTCDKKWRHEQTLTDHTLSILVLPTNLWPDLRGHTVEIAAALERAGAAIYQELTWQPPLLNRRPQTEP